MKSSHLVSIVAQGGIERARLDEIATRALLAIQHLPDAQRVGRQVQRG